MDSTFQTIVAVGIVAVAGGYSPRAEQGSVDVTRKSGGQVTTERALPSDPVLPGDTVYVRERWF